MRDEDLLKQVAHEGKVVIGGKEFSIKAPKAEPKEIPTLKSGVWPNEHEGTWVDPDYAHAYVQTGVMAPEFLVEPNPTVKIDSFLPSTQNGHAQERPEVLLREGIRAALRGGLTQEKIKEIFELELVSHVMES